MTDETTTETDFDPFEGMSEEEQEQAAARLLAALGLDDEDKDGRAHIPVEGGPFEGLITKIRALDSERRTLLLWGSLKQVARFLTVADNDPTGRLAPQMNALARNTLELCNHIVNAEIVSQEDWTRTGDSKVDAIWEEWITVLDSMRLDPDDVPEDIRQRLADGTATDEDMEKVREILAAKTGVAPEHLDPQAIKVGRRDFAKSAPSSSATGYVPPRHDTKYL